MAAPNLTRGSTRVTIPNGQANLGPFDEDMYETGSGNPAVNAPPINASKFAHKVVGSHDVYAMGNENDSTANNVGHSHEPYGRFGSRT